MLVLVSEIGREARASTLTIANGVELPHRTVIQLARKYLNLLKEFGRVQFEIAPLETDGGRQRREIAWLNERQASFLITLMRNTEKVVAFKFALIKQFYAMAESLAKRADLEMRAEFLKKTEALSLEHSRPFGIGLRRRRTEKQAIKGELEILGIQLALAF